MKKLGMLRAMALCARYRKMEPAQRDALRAERLKALIAYARENSPYYARLYADVPRDAALSELPCVNKRALMEHWDDWVTDRAVTRAQVDAFMTNLDNVGRKFHGQYLVLTTSGSTGEPLVLLYDKNADHVLGAVSATRTYARAQDLRAFFKRGGKSIGVFADGGFYLSNSSIRARLLTMPWKKRQMRVSSALLPTPEIVRQLNEFQPAMLGGYPSNLELLIAEQESGRLHISPVIVMTGGEYLSDALRERLGEAFHCYVQTSYACTEGGCVAGECTHRHFHVNDDWVLVEPVDADNRPVADGELAHHWLLTNLFNYTQPLIRYEVSDRIVMHHEPCACGNPSPWLEIEGRNDDMIVLEADGQTVRIPPLAAYATLKEVHALRRFQLVLLDGNAMELRLEPQPAFTREQAFEQAQKALQAFLAGYGVRDVTIALSAEEPKQHPQSGKFKHILNARQS